MYSPATVRFASLIESRALFNDLLARLQCQTKRHALTPLRHPSRAVTYHIFTSPAGEDEYINPISGWIMQRIAGGAVPLRPAAEEEIRNMGHG